MVESQSRMIYKYCLILDSIQELELPCGADILDIQIQNKKLTLWALVDPHQKKLQKRIFSLKGTGHLLEGIENLKKYITTIQYSEGYVWHIYELWDLK